MAYRPGLCLRPRIALPSVELPRQSGAHTKAKANVVVAADATNAVDVATVVDATRVGAVGIGGAEGGPEPIITSISVSIVGYSGCIVHEAIVFIAYILIAE